MAEEATYGPGPSGGSSETIQVNINTSTEREDFTVPADCTVKQFTVRVSKQSDVPAEQLALMHSGRILSESELLSQHKGRDGSVRLRMVLRPPDSSSPPTSSLASDTDQSEETLQTPSPSPTSPLSLVEDFGCLGLTTRGPGFFSAVQQQMEKQLLADPELMCRVLGSPLVQSTFSPSTPELTRQLVLSNAQILQLLQTNSDVADMLNNQDTITQMLELAQNPNMIQEMIHSQDRALGNPQQMQSNPEAISDDFIVRQKMETKTKEQNLNPLLVQMEGNPLVTSSSGKSQPISGEREKTVPLLSDSTVPPIDLTAPPTADSIPQNTTTGGMQSLLEQIMASPDLMENLLSGPYVSSLLHSLSQNPDLAAQMLFSHPLFSENPEMQQQMRKQLPLFLQQMQSPELLSAMLNPRAMEALLQIQQGLQTLASEAPAFIPGSRLGDIETNANSATELPFDSLLNNQSESSPQDAVLTEQQQTFVQQMLQALANANNQPGTEHFEAQYRERSRKRSVNFNDGLDLASEMNNLKIHPEETFPPLYKIC
ncbi:ubiquilin-1-like [Lampris incognitus]|uniref:ubiquilin-1-like n=1 Tax=Lampris incognitus TaxID=2546036 RepID=UPI0024B48D3E|nr:ubiquilin-1-like [Lampris incognitus]